MQIEDNGQHKTESIKMHFAIDIKVVPLETGDKYRFLYIIQDGDNMRSMIYLIELPNRLKKKDVSITHLGYTALLSNAPVVIGKRRFLALSEVEDCVIYEILKQKTSNVFSPYLKELKRFPNMGIITSIDVNPFHKNLMINSFKREETLTSFQKGILLSPFSSTPTLSSAIKNFWILEADRVYLVVSMASTTRVFVLGNGFNWFLYKTISFSESILYCKKIHEN